MLAVVPVRNGALPAGGAEAVAECEGRALVIGDGADAAAKALAGVGRFVQACEAGAFAPGAWSLALAELVRHEHVVVLPGSPDGRDLAPRLAHALGRPLLAGALRVHDRGADCARHGGLVIEEATVDGAFVATLIPGVRGVAPHVHGTPLPAEPSITATRIDLPAARDAQLLEELPPDVATMDLAEAPRIVGGGAGLDTAERFAQLTAVGKAIGASMGATRVITDRGWVSHHRQIGTTGVVVDPRLYLAFGISGAVQHTSGLGQPDHVVSVNLEPHCPMMQMADLAIVADANATLDALAARLGLDAGTAREGGQPPEPAQPAVPHADASRPVG